tara:strand:- start:7311 stop:7526 length:216 start_codon:yes stop_codon:yes gene_type:complete
MQFQEKEAIHEASLIVARSFHKLYSNVDTSPSSLEVLDCYRAIRRMLPQDEIGGRRYGASEASNVMNGDDI